MERTITLSEIAACSTWTVKDNSPRGCKTVSTAAVKVGDMVVVNNYFTRVIDDPQPETVTEATEAAEPAAQAETAAAAENAAEDAQAAQKPARVHISNGNSKMGQIPSVSLLPGVTCAAGVPCLKDCYACKLARLRPNVRRSWEENTQIARENPDAFFAVVNAAMKTTRYFRFHVSGDFFSADYFRRCVETVAENPGCTVLAFTKQFRIVNDFIAAGGQIPQNFKIIFSGWRGWKPENPYGFPETNVIFPGDAVPDDWKICGGNCTECACRGVGCWELQHGETIAFYKH